MMLTNINSQSARFLIAAIVFAVVLTPATSSNAARPNELTSEIDGGYPRPVLLRSETAQQCDGKVHELKQGGRIALTCEVD